MEEKPISVDEPGNSFPTTPATLTVQAVDRQTEIAETMLMGLRLVEQGVSRKVFVTVLTGSRSSLRMRDRRAYLTWLVGMGRNR
jgi:hypothetical protein